MTRKLFVLSQGIVVALGLLALPSCGGTTTEAEKSLPEGHTVDDGHDHSDGEHHEGDGHKHTDGDDHSHEAEK